MAAARPTRPLVLLALACALAYAAACAEGAPPSTDTPRATGGSAPAATGDSAPRDSARAAYLRQVDSLLLDTQLHELRGHLSIKARNTNPDDPESPLRDLDVPHPPGIGPHTYLGVMHAELEALRTALGREAVPVTVEEDRVYLGRAPRELLVIGHRHGGQLFVPVKLMARPYGAYVRVACPLANCASIWPAEILRFMRDSGYTASAGVIEGWMEGLLDRVDVRRMPRG